MSGRLSAGRQFVVATAAATARMLQQHTATTSFSRSSIKRAAKSNTRTYQSPAASGSLVGTVTWCTPVNRGTRLFLPPPDIEGHASGRAVGSIARLASPVLRRPQYPCPSGGADEIANCGYEPRRAGFRCNKWELQRSTPQCELN